MKRKKKLKDHTVKYLCGNLFYCLKGVSTVYLWGCHFCFRFVQSEIQKKKSDKLPFSLSHIWTLEVHIVQWSRYMEKSNYTPVCVWVIDHVIFNPMGGFCGPAPSLPPGLSVMCLYLSRLSALLSIHPWHPSIYPSLCHSSSPPLPHPFAHSLAPLLFSLLLIFQSRWKARLIKYWWWGVRCVEAAPHRGRVAGHRDLQEARGDSEPRQRTRGRVW